MLYIICRAVRISQAQSQGSTQGQAKNINIDILRLKSTQETRQVNARAGATARPYAGPSLALGWGLVGDDNLGA